jgi:hypothetical protein
LDSTHAMNALAVGSSADGSDTSGFPQAKMYGSRSGIGVNSFGASLKF